MKTFAIAGCGHLGKIVAKAYKDGLLGGYRLAAAYSRKKADAEAIVSGTDAEAMASMDEVISLRPDLIIETASIALLKDFAVKALEAGIGIIPLSIGAFADSAFKERALAAAQGSGARIYIPSGAVAVFKQIEFLRRRIFPIKIMFCSVCGEQVYIAFADGRQLHIIAFV